MSGDVRRGIEAGNPGQYAGVVVRGPKRAAVKSNRARSSLERGGCGRVAGRVKNADGSRAT